MDAKAVQGAESYQCPCVEQCREIVGTAVKMARAASGGPFISYLHAAKRTDMS